MASAGAKRLREDDGSGLGLDGAANGVREHTLWVGSLDSKTTEYQLSRLFKPFAPLVRLDLLYHKAGPNRGQPRGYGFVELSSREKASAARQALDGFELNGRAIAVRFVSDRILYDGGLPGGSGGSGARAGGDLKEGREYLTDAEREADRRAAAARQTSKGVATTHVLARTLDAKLAAIRARLGVGAAASGAGAAGRAAPAPRHAGTVDTADKADSGGTGGRPGASVAAGGGPASRVGAEGAGRDPTAAAAAARQPPPAAGTG